MIANSTMAMTAHLLSLNTTQLIPMTATTTNLQSKKRKHKSVVRFVPGDRVAEKPKLSTIIASNPEALAIASRNLTQRYGTVISIQYKANTNKVMTPYVEVMWDGQKSTAVHAQARICKTEDLPEIVSDYRNTIGG